MSQIFIVENLTGPQRVDLYVISKNQGITRTTAKRLIMEGLITVNSQKVRSNFKVNNGDKISLDVEGSKNFIDKENLTELKPLKMKLDIVFEDDSIIALNKPAGIVVHPVPNHREDTLMNGLVYHFKDKADNVNIRIRPVHRLDKDTSGIIIFSKNIEAHDYYSSLFENHSIEKVYYAVVAGDFAEYIKAKSRKDYFEIFSYIGRSQRESKLYMNTNKEKGLPARTRVYFKKYWKNPERKNRIYSLVKVVPETGRTHQIRVHLSGIGFPIVGDSLYSRHYYTRLMLHAAELKLKLFKSQEKEIILKADLPEVFD